MGDVRLLVCGGRDFWNPPLAYEVLDDLHAKYGFSFVVHGNARGADRLGGIWAKLRGIKVIACPADWAKHGKRAGPIRNQNMLGHLDPASAIVVAFPGGAGTRDMVKRAERAGFTIVTVDCPRLPL